MRAGEDLFESVIWADLLPNIASVISAILEMPNSTFFSPEKIAEQVELVFSAIEPFLQVKSNR